MVDLAGVPGLGLFLSTLVESGSGALVFAGSLFSTAELARYFPFTNCPVDDLVSFGQMEVSLGISEGSGAGTMIEGLIGISEGLGSGKITESSLGTPEGLGAGSESFAISSATIIADGLSKLTSTSESGESGRGSNGALLLEDLGEVEILLLSSVGLRFSLTHFSGIFSFLSNSSGTFLIT